MDEQNAQLVLSANNIDKNIIAIGYWAYAINPLTDKRTTHVVHFFEYTNIAECGYTSEMLVTTDLFTIQNMRRCKYCVRAMMKCCNPSPAHHPVVGRRGAQAVEIIMRGGDTMTDYQKALDEVKRAWKVKIETTFTRNVTITKREALRFLNFMEAADQDAPLADVSIIEGYGTIVVLRKPKN